MVAMSTHLNRPRDAYMNELQRPDSASDAKSDSIFSVGAGGQADKKAAEKDPETWHGLVWRIVRDAIDSDAKLIRACILICFVATALWLIASVGRLWVSEPRHGAPIPVRAAACSRACTPIWA